MKHGLYYARCILLVLLSLVSSCRFVCQGKTIHANKHMPLQAQIQNEKTTYIIKTPFDLNGEKISIPKGATIRFRKRGLIKNGLILADSARIIFSRKVDFEDCSFSGLFCNTKCNLKNFGYQDQSAMVSMVSFANSCISRCHISISRNVMIDEILPVITNEVEIDANGFTVHVLRESEFTTTLGQSCAIFRMDSGGTVKNMRFYNESNNRCSLFNIKNGNYLFDNIECENKGYFGAAIYAPIQNKVTSCAINNIRLIGMGVSGIEKGFLQYGVYVCALDKVSLKNGYIYRCGCDGATLIAEHVVVDNLTSNFNGVDKVTLPGVAGLYVCSRPVEVIKDVSVSNCTFIGNNGHGLDIARNARAYPYKGEVLQTINVNSCMCSNNGLSGVSIEGAENASILNCRLSNNGNNVFGDARRAGLNIQRLFTDGKPMNTYVIDNNTFEDAEGCQLYDILFSKPSQTADYREGNVKLIGNKFARRNIKNAKHLKSVSGQEVVYE